MRVMAGAETKLGDHTLVMSHGRMVFDTAISAYIPPLRRRVYFGPTDIYYGITFDSKED